MQLSLVFMTGRADPQLGWVIDGIRQQAHPSDRIELVVVDVFGRTIAELAPDHDTSVFERCRATLPKPNIWQGKYRVTNADWWATANARNTAIALAQHDFMAFLDDRCRLGPKWLEVVRGYAARRDAVVCGTYDKLEGVERRRTTDHRRAHASAGMKNCGGGWLYGCTFGLPTEWALEVNGFEEGCDGLTGEDYIFGLMLGNAGRRIDFSVEMYVEQDRQPGNESCKGSYKCADKGPIGTPEDKSHHALKRFGTRKSTEFTPNLRALRHHLAAGNDFPVPNPEYEYRDWFDGQLISTM